MDQKLNNYTSSMFHVSECLSSFCGVEYDLSNRIDPQEKEDEQEDLRFKYRLSKTNHTTCEYCGSQNLREYDIWHEANEDNHSGELILTDVQQVCLDCKASQH
jgi:ribosomal protein L32